MCNGAICLGHVFGKYDLIEQNCFVVTPSSRNTEETFDLIESDETHDSKTGAKASTIKQPPKVITYYLNPILVTTTDPNTLHAFPVLALRTKWDAHSSYHFACGTRLEDFRWNPRHDERFYFWFILQSSVLQLLGLFTMGLPLAFR